MKFKSFLFSTICAAVLNMPTFAVLAQTPPRTGPLQIQNNLDEINKGGNVPQQTGRGNLGFGVRSFTSQAQINALNGGKVPGYFQDQWIALGGNVPLTLTFDTYNNYAHDGTWCIMNTDRYVGPRITGGAAGKRIVAGPIDFTLWPQSSVCMMAANGTLSTFVPALTRIPKQGQISGETLAISNITWSAGIATATVADDTFLQNYALVTITGANVSGYNTTTPQPITLVGNGTQFTYPVVSNPNGTATTGSVHDTSGYFVIYVNPSTGVNSTANDGLTPSRAFASIGYAVTVVTQNQFQPDFDLSNGGSSYIQVVLASNTNDATSVHCSTQGPQGAGGHQLILKGHPPNPVVSGSALNNTIEANLGCILFLEDLVVDAQAGNSCIAPHQGGLVFLQQGLHLRNCPSGYIVFDQSKAYFAKTLIIDCSLGSGTNLINLQAGSSVEVPGAISIMFPVPCNFSGDVVFATLGSGLSLNNVTFDIGGTRITPTAATWSGGNATFTVPDTSFMTTGHTLQVMGIFPYGYNGVFTINNIVDSTHVQVPLASNPGIVTTQTFGTLVYDPTSPITGRAIELHSNASMSKNGTDIPGVGVTIDSGGVINGVDYASLQHTWTDVQTFRNGPVIGSPTQATTLTVSLEAATSVRRQIEIFTGSLGAWKFGADDLSGNNFFIERFDGSGALVDRSMQINGTTGLVSFLDGVKIQTGGLQLGVPTGGDKGTGTINAQGIYYSNNVPGVDCASGTVNAATAVVSKGIWVHC